MLTLNRAHSQLWVIIGIVGICGGYLGVSSPYGTQILGGLCGCLGATCLAFSISTTSEKQTATIRYGLLALNACFIGAIWFGIYFLATGAALCMIPIWVMLYRPASLSRILGDKPIQTLTTGIGIIAIAIYGIGLWLNTKNSMPTTKDSITFTMSPWDGWPIWAVVSGFVAASLANAFLEECLWTGVISDLLSRTWLGAAFTAICFGSIHYWAIPDGALGVLLAIIFSGFMHILRRIGNWNITANIMVHCIVDIYLLTAYYL